MVRNRPPSLRTRIDECATPAEEADAMGNAEGAGMLRRLLLRFVFTFGSG